MIVVDRLEILLKDQYNEYIIKLKKIKITIAFNLSRKLINNLIKKISFYVLQKIQKQ